MSRLPNLQRMFAFIVIIAAMAGCLAYWRDTETTLAADRARAGERVEQQALLTSQAADQALDRLMDGFDLAAKQLRASWLTNRAAFDGAAQEVIRHYPEGAITHVLVLDAQGNLAYSSSDSETWLYFGDRDYFRAQSGSRNDWLYVSPPLAARLTSGWVVALSRPIIIDRAFRGMIVLSLRPAYVADTFAALRRNQDDVVDIAHADGRLFSRPEQKLAPSDEGRLTDNPAFAPAAPRRGVYRDAPSGRVLGWTHSGRWPLISIAALDETPARQALEAHERQSRREAAGACLAIMALATAVAGLLLVGAQRQRLLQDSRNSQMAAAERYRSLLRTASDGIHVMDRNGRLREASQSFLDMLGYSREESAGLSVYDWDVHFSAAEIEAFLASACSPIDGGGMRQFRVRTRHRRRDGAVIDVEVNLSSVVVDGQTCLYASARDITQQVAMEQELRRSNAELEQFAYVVSHDLRQPLRAVTSYLALLKRELGDNLSDDAHEFIGFASDGARRMDELIRSLLEYSRIGRLEAPFDNVALDEVTASAALMLSDSIADVGGTITVQSPLPTIRGDHSELLRLFENLLGNAQKYRAPDRPLRIAIGCDENGGEWRVWVRDNGVGIPPKDHERIFGIFQRLVGREIEGAGIGLSVCRKIAEHHGGRIWVESAPGQGSVFIIAFPRPEAAAAPQAPTALAA